MADSCGCAKTPDAGIRHVVRSTRRIVRCVPTVCCITRCTEGGAAIPEGLVWRIFDTKTDASGELYVIKGGSFLCASSYCARYRAAARQFQERGLGTDHIGVRLIDARRAPPH